MNRISFKLRMYQQVRTFKKTETRRVGGMPFMEGQILLVSHPHIRPKAGPFHPEHLQHMLEWVAGEGRSAVSNAWGPKESEKMVPPGYKCMAGMYLPVWATSHGVKVLKVRREPLDAITEEGAAAEGFDSRRDFLEYVKNMRTGDFCPSISVQVVQFELLTIEQLHSKGILELAVPKYDHSQWRRGWEKCLPKCMAQAMGVL